MKLGLGIDTGGTYTDAVLYDFDGGTVVATAKALTTYDDLSRGITASFSALPQDLLCRAELISLSTTLATNACVEGKFARGRLVLLGYDPRILGPYGVEYGLPPLDELICLSGSHTMAGEPRQEPDWDALAAHVRQTAGTADAYGVVEAWGMRNPAFELKAKEIIQEVTGRPVVCASELSDEVNSLRRAATTLLNANLISLIDGLMTSVRRSLSGHGLNAPLMIVRGDGTLMAESFARRHPVETLLSGPAASVVGALSLTRQPGGVAVDMGGTTTDLAVLRDGRARLVPRGVQVGAWRTGTRAIAVRTIGLGGDSLIRLDRYDRIVIGPRKALPLSHLAADHPEVKAEIAAMLEMSETVYPRCEFLLLRDTARIPRVADRLTPAMMRVVAALEKGPLSKRALARATDQSPTLMNTALLEDAGIVTRSGLTPTDIMHVRGDYAPWDRDAAGMGLAILALLTGQPPQAAADAIVARVERSLFDLVAGHLLTDERGEALCDEEAARPLMNLAYDPVHPDIAVNLQCPHPLISLGAPTHVYLGRVAQALRTRVITPEHAEVANAVGAITGCVMSEVSVLVKPLYEVAGIVGFTCHSRTGFHQCIKQEDALAWASQAAREEALAQLHDMGAPGGEVAVAIHENNGDTREGGQGLLLDIVVTARAVSQRTIV